MMPCSNTQLRFQKLYKELENGLPVHCMADVGFVGVKWLIQLVTWEEF